MFRVRFNQSFVSAKISVGEGSEGVALKTLMGDDGPLTEVRLNDGRIVAVPSEILTNLDA